MKAAIYSPYLDTLGGGERYMMTIAEILSKLGYDVNVFLDKHLSSCGSSHLKDALSERFALNLQDVDFIKAPIGVDSNFLTRLSFLNSYDLFFYLTDGSIFYPTARKNILHIQSPFRRHSKNIWEKIKLNGWDLIIYNSQFTQQNAADDWPIESRVVYPPVDVAKIKPLKKKKYILSVGRFFGYLKDKKHSLLIKIFSELMKDSSAKGWSLHLAGSASIGDEKYISELKELARGLPINFYPNLEYDKLTKLYGESSIYWHAAGFGETDPTKMEHFGIATVEAMAGGSIPIVIEKGGQREIVEYGQSGFLWNDPKKCKELTLKNIKNEGLRKKIALQAVKRAGDFSKKIFEKQISRLSESI